MKKAAQQAKLDLPESFSKVFSQEFKKYHGKLVLLFLKVKNGFEKKESILPTKEKSSIVALLETGKEFLKMNQQEYDYLNTRVFFDLLDALSGAAHYLDRFKAPGEVFKAAADQYPMSPSGEQTPPPFPPGELVEDTRTGDLAKVIWYPQQQPGNIPYLMVGVQFLDETGKPKKNEKGKLKPTYVPTTVLREVVKLEDF